MGICCLFIVNAYHLFYDLISPHTVSSMEPRPFITQTHIPTLIKCHCIYGKKSIFIKLIGYGIQNHCTSIEGHLSLTKYITCLDVLICIICRSKSSILGLCLRQCWPSKMCSLMNLTKIGLL